MHLQPISHHERACDLPRPREPLVSFRDLQCEFSITHGQLMGLVSNDPACPKPTFRHAHNTYYNAAAMRRWLRDRMSRKRG